MTTIFKDPVEIGGLRFNTKEPDELGVRYYCDMLEDWDDTADPQPVTSAFSYNDGVVAAPRFPLKEQYIEFGGYLMAPSNLALEQAMDKLKIVLAVNPQLRLIRYSAIPKSLTVRASSRVEFPQAIKSSTDHAARWRVQMMAPWPFKESPLPHIMEAGVYAGADYFRTYTNYNRTYTDYHRTYTTNTPVVEVVRPDSIVLVNAGNANALPVVEIYGPLETGDWSLVNETTNQRFALDIDLGIGSMLMVDSKTKAATVMGEPVDYFLRGDWLTLVPGVNRLRLLTTKPDPNTYFRIMAYNTYR